MQRLDEIEEQVRKKIATTAYSESTKEELLIPIIAHHLFEQEKKVSNKLAKLTDLYKHEVPCSVLRDFINQMTGRK